MRVSAFVVVILLLAYHTLSLSASQKTPETVAKSFKKFDNNKDGILSEDEVKDFFYNEYMKDFEGIDIDPKFIDSTLSFILNADKNDNGIELLEFIDVIVPKSDFTKKREPDYYPEQEL